MRYEMSERSIVCASVIKAEASDRSLADGCVISSSAEKIIECSQWRARTGEGGKECNGFIRCRVLSWTKPVNSAISAAFYIWDWNLIKIFERTVIMGCKRFGKEIWFIRACN